MKIKENKGLKYFGIFVLVSLFINLLLAIITKIFNVEFVKPESVVDGPYIFYNINILNYNIPISQTVVNTWVLIFLIWLFLHFATNKLSVKNPGRMQIILEEIYLFVEKSFTAGYGKYKKYFMSFFTALISLIAMSNLSFFLFPFVPLITRGKDGVLEVTPFFRTATADFNTTLGLALVVFVIFVGIIIKQKGLFGFIKELCHPFAVMLPINLIGELAKPINISVRLFGNMIAGLVILTMVYDLDIPNLISKLTGNYLQGPFSVALLWPIFLQLYLDVFVGLLQAFVFTVLSSVYIGQSIGVVEEN